MVRCFYAEQYSNTQLIKSRIDGLSTLQEGSTTGDAELIGIRTGYDSTNYSSAGEAVREQVSELHNSINPLSSELADIRTGANGTIYDSAGKAVRNQFNQIAQVTIGMNKVNPEDLYDGYYAQNAQTSYLIAFVESDEYICSGFIPITHPYCTTGGKRNGSWSTIRNGYALFDENLAPISKNAAQTYTVIDLSESNAKYIRVWWNKAEYTSPYFVGFSNTDVPMSYTDFKRTVTLPDVETISGYNIHSMNTVLTAVREQVSELHNSINPLSSELADIRTGANGTIYDSAGKAVRNQFNQIARVTIGMNKVNPEDLYDGYYERNAQTSYRTVFVESDEYICSGFIPITHPYCITGATYNGSWNTIRSGYALFDENLAPISKSSARTYTVIDLSESNAKYIRVWWGKNFFSAPFYVGFSDNNEYLSYSAYSVNVDMPDVYSIGGISISQLNSNIEEVNRLSALYPDTASDRVCCWGDSLTYGSGVSESSNTYPNKLLALLRNNGNTQFPASYGVLNNGNAGGGVETIAAYQGGIVLNVKPTTIPAEGSVQIELETFLGDNVIMMRRAGNYITSQNLFDYKNTGEKMNHCYIAGVKGDLLRDANGNYVFTRLESGEAVTIDRPIPLITYGAAELNLPSDIAVIWAGTNDIRMDIDEIISFIRLMIDKLGNDKYIIVGLTAKNYHSDIESKNRKLGLAFGKHFLDVRSYILNYGLQDEGLTPTEEDTAALAQGLMPPSLMHDATHFNDYGYDVVANQVYLKGKSLGYWN